MFSAAAPRPSLVDTGQQDGASIAQVAFNRHSHGAVGNAMSQLR